MSVLEKYGLLALNNEKGKFYSDASMYKQFIIAGAILMDLSLKERIHVKDKVVYIKNPEPTGIDYYDYFLNMIKISKKPKKLLSWINKFSRKTRKLAKFLINELEASRKLIVKKYPFLGIFKKRRFYLPDPLIQDKIVQDIKQLIHGQKEETEEEILLLSLLKHTRLDHRLFERQYRKNIKSRVKELIAEEEIGKSVRDAIAAAQAAAASAASAAV